MLHWGNGWSWGWGSVCDPVPQPPFAHPMGWGRNGKDAAVAADGKAVPALAHRCEQRAFLAGDSSDLLGSWHRRERSTQGCPSSPWAAERVPMLRWDGDV